MENHCRLSEIRELLMFMYKYNYFVNKYFDYDFYECLYGNNSKIWIETLINIKWKYILL